jgi:hypothetical protein
LPITEGIGTRFQEIAMSTQQPSAPEQPSQAWQPPSDASLPAQYGVVYCRGCGHPVNPQAAICVNCGVATGTGLPQARPANPKSKTTAVLLVVFFGLLGWIYTYQRDSWKFWLNLALSIVTIGIWAIVAWVWAIIDIAVRPSEWYEAFPNG